MSVALVIDHILSQRISHSIVASLKMHSFPFFSIALQMIDDILRGQNGGED